MTTSKQKEDAEDARRVFKHFHWRTLLSGGLAGCVAKTIVAPIDRVKILLQVHSRHYDQYGIFESFVRVYQKEGFAALYKGNSVQMLRIFPYAAMQFTSFETYKHINRMVFASSSSSESADHWANSFVCGSLAGITALSCTYPLDIIHSRLAFQFRGEHIYAGIADSIRKIYAEKRSITSFYRGYSISVLGMMPYAGLSFGSFEQFKRLLLNNRVRWLTMPATAPKAAATSHSVSVPSNGEYYELTVPGRLICGALTGVIAQTVTYPIDVVRRHMQLVTMITDSSARIKMGIVDTLKYVYNTYGLANGLFRGITLNYIRAVPMVSTSFCMYEMSRKYLGLETSQLIKTH